MRAMRCPTAPHHHRRRKRAHPSRRIPEDISGDFVALSVSDTGSGIPPDLVPRVVEPFFTTKAPDKGTGLGLSQVYGFARRSDGTVAITSEVGRGTKVTVYLPRSYAALAAPSPRTRRTMPRLTGKPFWWWRTMPMCSRSRYHSQSSSATAHGSGNGFGGARHPRHPQAR